MPCCFPCPEATHVPLLSLNISFDESQCMMYACIHGHLNDSLVPRFLNISFFKDLIRKLNRDVYGHSLEFRFIHLFRM